MHACMNTEDTHDASPITWVFFQQTLHIFHEDLNVISPVNFSGPIPHWPLDHSESLPWVQLLFPYFIKTPTTLCRNVYFCVFVHHWPLPFERSETTYSDVAQAEACLLLDEGFFCEARKDKGHFSLWAKCHGPSGEQFEKQLPGNLFLSPGPSLSLYWDLGWVGVEDSCLCCVSAFSHAN